MENEIKGFDDRFIVEEQERLIRGAREKKYDSNIEDNFFDYLNRINKEKIEKIEDNELVFDDRELEGLPNNPMKELSLEDESKLKEEVNSLFDNWKDRYVNEKTKDIKHGFDDSNFEEDLIKIKKLGEKIRKENIKIPYIPDFLFNGLISKIKDSLYGFVIGDALGVPVEFMSREKLIKNPVTSMLGYRNHNVEEGVWSDDTSMTLATIDSIINCNGLNYNDMMNNFLMWYGKYKYTATNKVFDIGRTTYDALLDYAENKKNPVECGLKGINDNGNGSLMRMLPIAIYCYYNKYNEPEIYNIVKDVSSLTHAHEISILGCYLYVLYIINILNGNDKYESLDILKKVNLNKFSNEAINEYKRILKENISKEKINNIYSSGYVIHTLESVLYVILNTDSFDQALIGAINLGEDTDTIGAITGSIAGILYRYDSIPEKWLKKLKNKEYLNEIIWRFENYFQENKG